MGFFLEQAGRRYLILEGAEEAGAFFERFPRNRSLISFNKVHSIYKDPEILGWYLRAHLFLNPVLQALRPISPIAWLPVATLWFGSGDLSAIFLIFLSSFFPIVVSTSSAVRSIENRYLKAAENFGVHGLELARRIVLPAILPQVLTGLRVALGIAWVVVVAAEMLGVRSGLGYQVNDARNNLRFDLVTAAMVVIGAIGYGLDGIFRAFERRQLLRLGVRPLS